MGEGEQTDIVRTNDQSGSNIAASGRDVNVAAMPQNEGKNKLTTLTRDDIHPGQFGEDETEIVIQRHGMYIRKPNDDPRIGSLTEQAIADETGSAQAYFEELMASLSPEEREQISPSFWPLENRDHHDLHK